jgi:hypothetical protein
MQRCKLCHKEVRWFVSPDGKNGWRHRAKKHSCKDPENIDGTEDYRKPEQRVCRKCNQPVKLEGDGITQDWKYVHVVEGNCEKTLSNGETRVPLKIINTTGGPWMSVDLKFLTISKKARTCVAKIEAAHIAGGVLNVYDRKGIFVVKGLGEIPSRCHLSLDSALNNVRYRIWRYQNCMGNWKWRKAELEAIRRRDILATIEKCDNCPCDWCPHYAENANECCAAPDLETMEKVKCPYTEEKKEVKTV